MKTTMSSNIPPGPDDEEELVVGWQEKLFSQVSQNVRISKLLSLALASSQKAKAPYCYAGDPVSSSAQGNFSLSLPISLILTFCHHLTLSC